MLGLYEKGFKPPSSLSSFNSLYSELPLIPLALTPSTEDDVRTSLMFYIALNKFECNALSLICSVIKTTVVNIYSGLISFSTINTIPNSKSNHKSC